MRMGPILNKTNEEAVNAAVDDAAALAQLFLPQFAAYIVLGRALAKSAPELYRDVTRLISNAEPTPEDKAELARKLHMLANPEQA